jgi:hypothetical protein
MLNYDRTQTIPSTIDQQYRRLIRHFQLVDFLSTGLL